MPGRRYDGHRRSRRPGRNDRKARRTRAASDGSPGGGGRVALMHLTPNTVRRPGLFPSGSKPIRLPGVVGGPGPTCRQRPGRITQDRDFQSWRRAKTPADPAVGDVYLREGGRSSGIALEVHKASDSSAL